MTMPKDTKHFILIYCRNGGNFNCLIGDVENQTLQRKSSTATETNKQMVFDSATWSTYISSTPATIQSNGTITFTGSVSVNTGGAASQVFLICWST